MLSGDEILRRLEKAINLSEERFVVDLPRGDPFGVLVAIILSQNTNDKNSIAALRRLAERVGLSPEKIAESNVREIEDAIRSAGLYREKARRIKKLAELVAGGKVSLEELLSLPVEEARRRLLSIEGIGPKTADVFLAVFGKPTFGVDVHAARVAKRLGIVHEKAGYEEVRRAYMELFKGHNYDRAHRLIIALGRNWCRARNPLCHRCPLHDICPSGGIPAGTSRGRRGI